MGNEMRGREVWQGEEGKREGEERGEVEGLEARKGGEEGEGSGERRGNKMGEVQ